MTTFDTISRVRSQSRAKNAARLVLLNLATRADGNNICYPSVTLQQKDTLLGRSTIVLAIQHLEAIGELYAHHHHGKKTNYLIAVGLTAEQIAACLRAQEEFNIADQDIQAAVKTIIACRAKAEAELAKVKTSSDFGLVQNSDETSSESGTELVQNLAPNYHIEESYNYQILATVETPVEARPENLLISQEPAQPTKQADAPMPESKDPNPQLRRTPFPVSAGDRVNWQTVGGWGGGANVQAAARVLAVKGQRVAIAVYDLRAKAVVEKTVTPGKLTPRDAASAQDADLDAYFDQWTAKRDKPRKEPERGPLYKAVHEILLGITDPGDGKHMISRINGLRRVVLDAESVGKPTAEQDTQIAEYLRVQFPRWYRKHNGQRPNDPPLALPTNPQKVAHWYGRYAEARRNYDAQQAAEAVKPTAAQADPGCPHCGGTGKVSIYKSANDKWVPMRYGDLVPTGVTETASATCRCILTKGA